MRSDVCETCWSFLPERATFCGLCGNPVRKKLDQIVSAPTQTPTGGGSVDQQALALHLHPTVLLPQDLQLPEEEHERRGMWQEGLLLGGVFGTLGVDEAAEQALPMAQGLPQLGSAPVAQGVPQLSFPSQGQKQNMAPPKHANQRTMPPQAGTGNKLNRSVSPAMLASPLQKTQRQNVNPLYIGLAAAAIIIIIAIVLLVPLLVNASPSKTLTPTPVVPAVTVTATLPVTPQPTLASSGDSWPGGTILLHGQSFPPHGTVIITLDGVALAFSAQPDAHAYRLLSRVYAPDMRHRGFSALNPADATTVQNDGTFDKQLIIPMDWQPGSRHTIQAAVQHGSGSAIAQLKLAVVAQYATPTPTPATPVPNTTPTPTPTLSPGVTPTPTPSPTPGPVWCLSASAASLSFAGVSGKNDPPAQTVTITNCGSAGTWSTAVTTTDGAAWLGISPVGGDLSTNSNQGVVVAVSNVSAQLGSGTYTGQVIFTLGTATQTVSITLTVTRAPCLRTGTSALTFTTVVGSNPQDQSVTLFDCGPSGSWSGSVATSSGGSWLSISPTSGTLTSGARQVVTVSATSAGRYASTTLAAGTYTGSLTFMLGMSASTVSVTLIVQNAPCITASPTALSFSEYIGHGASSAQVVLTDCSDTGTVTAATSTTDGASWLSTNLTAGTSISANATLAVSITANNILNIAGTYTGNVTFTITTTAGTRNVTVAVTLSMSSVIG